MNRLGLDDALVKTRESLAPYAPMRQAPALPDHVYLQMANLSTGWVYRIAEDGRYLVTPYGGVEGQHLVFTVRGEQGVKTVEVRASLRGW
jgi:hypothetical protein